MGREFLKWLVIKSWRRLDCGKWFLNEGRVFFWDVRLFKGIFFCVRFCVAGWGFRDDVMRDFGIVGRMLFLSFSILLLDDGRREGS